LLPGAAAAIRPTRIVRGVPLRDVGALPFDGEAPLPTPLGRGQRDVCWATVGILVEVIFDCAIAARPHCPRRAEVVAAAALAGEEPVWPPPWPATAVALDGARAEVRAGEVTMCRGRRGGLAGDPRRKRKREPGEEPEEWVRVDPTPAEWEWAAASYEKAAEWCSSSQLAVVQGRTRYLPPPLPDAVKHLEIDAIAETVAGDLLPIDWACHAPATVLEDALLEAEERSEEAWDVLQHFLLEKDTTWRMRHWTLRDPAARVPRELCQFRGFLALHVVGGAHIVERYYEAPLRRARPPLDDPDP